MTRPRQCGKKTYLCCLSLLPRVLGTVRAKGGSPTVPRPGMWGARGVNVRAALTRTTLRDPTQPQKGLARPRLELLIPRALRGAVMSRQVPGVCGPCPPPEHSQGRSWAAAGGTGQG